MFKDTLLYCPKHDIHTSKRHGECPICKDPETFWEEYNQKLQRMMNGE